MRYAIFLTALLAGTAANADALDVVQSKSNFMQIVKGKDLTRMGIILQVAENGQITGRAFGRDVSGEWRWQDGYFCRSLYWGSRDLGDNCQQVAIDDGDIRFTSDRGKGQHANFGLR